MADKRDNVSRIKRASPLGTSIFLTVRTLDPFLQYGILARGLADPLLNFLSLSPSPANGSVVALGLPLQSLTFLGMSTALTIKHIYWVLYIGESEIRPGDGIAVGVFNSLFNSVNSIISLTAASAFTLSFLTNNFNTTPLSPLFILGTVSYIIGIAFETISETQRKNFKANPKNKGKPYTGGLFSWARHINYGGYTIMRTGYAIACGGWIYGSLVAAFFFRDFVVRGVPVLDEYCGKRVSCFASLT